MRAARGRDLEEIGACYRAVAGSAVAEAIAERIVRVISRLEAHPESAPRVTGRPAIRVMLVRRYPYKIFYRLRGDVVEILHLRHTARRPWQGP